LTTLLLEDEATQARSALLGCKLVEEAVEKQLAENKLVTCADLAGDTSLELNNVGVVDEAEAAQHTLPALQLVKLDHGQSV
nr:hypothetical protein [Tanacetum cinerariifolium]